MSRPYECPRCEETRDADDATEAPCVSCGVCAECAPTSGGIGNSDRCEDCDPQSIDYTETTYSDGRTTHDGIQVAWEDVSEALGHDHRGTPADDEALVALLLASGAPRWVAGASGWVDEHGWGVYREKRETAGRPPLDDGEETERITIRLTATEYDAVAKLAESEGWTYAGRPSVGKAARELLRSALKNWPTE